MTETKGSQLAVTTGQDHAICRFAFLVLLLLSAIFVRAEHLGLERAEPSTRAQYHAIPTALSVLYFDWDADYTGNASVAWHFQGKPGSEVDRSISEVLSSDFAAGEEVYYWVADDRGLFVYVAAAFCLFGPSIKALFYFYFVVLGGSALLFFAVAWRQRQARFFLLAYLMALLCILPVWAIVSGNPDPDEASIHLSESRLFGLLALLPAAHIYFVSCVRERPSPLQLFALFAQIVFFMSLIQARSSIQWLLIALLALLICQGIWLALQRENYWRKIALGIALIAAIGSLHGYQRLAHNSAYFDQIGARTFWHNVIMGLAANAFFVNKFEINGDDRSAIRAVIKHRIAPEAAKDPEKLKALVQIALDSLGGHRDYDWTEHENQARDLYLSQFQEHPRQFVLTYINKVGNALTCFTYAFGLDAYFSAVCGNPETKRTSIGPVFLALAVLTFAASFFIASGSPATCDPIDDLLTFLVAILPFSVLPFMIIYTAIVTQANTMLILMMLVFVMAFWFGRVAANTTVWRQYLGPNLRDHPVTQALARLRRGKER